MNEVTPITVTRQDKNSNWFLVESPQLSDSELYQKMQPKWIEIASSDYGLFSLVYCIQNPNAGVWLHYLAGSDSPRTHAAGCYQITSWS